MYTIPKKLIIGQEQKWRLIHNLSFHREGRSKSVNEGILNRDFPVTYPTVTTAAHLLFCEAPKNSVIWGRDMTAYYRHLMVNPACWWLMGSSFGEAFYFDSYCPFGARSMPAVFQRLTDAIRIIALRRAKCDGLVALLDDFLGVTFRKEHDTDEGLLLRAKQQSEAFDLELLRLGLVKNAKKDLRPCWSGVWLGVQFKMRTHELAIPVEKIRATRAFFFVMITNQTGMAPDKVLAGELRVLVGKLSHMSMTWVIGKILLWPLYRAMACAYSIVGGKRVMRNKQMIRMNAACKEALAEWDTKLEKENLSRQFVSCTGGLKITVVALWRSTDTERKLKVLELRSERGTIRDICPRTNSATKLTRSRQVMAAAITLLHKWLLLWVGDCERVIHLRSNISKLITYVSKDFYPAGLEEKHFVLSLKIGRLLEGAENEQTRQMYGYFIN